MCPVNKYEELELLFEIEKLLTIKGGAYVFAKQIPESGAFTLTDHATLAGFPVRKQLSVPRAFIKDGKLRTDLFVLQLKNNGDLVHFALGQTVTLTA